MENKLLTYILQMQKQSSTQSVPRLAKAQTGISMNVESGTYKPTAKVVTQADIKRQQEEVRRQEEQARKDKLNAAVKRQRENQSYISQDNRTAGERENDRIKGMNAQMQEIQRNSPLAQTFGSFTPSGYNPGAGSVAANQFVRTVPLIAAGAAGARALPSIMAGLNAPMAGVAGLTGNNIMNAGFAYEAAKNLPNVGRSIKTAYQNPTLSNVGNATAETALTALNALPFAAEASRGVAPFANEIKSAFTLTGPQRNLKDLNYAKKVYEPLGYQIPENLERIAKSDVLTDRTVRGLVNRDNSVYRGVNVDLEALKERLVRNNKLISKFSGKPPQEAIDQYDVLIGNLKKANVDVNNPEEIAKYMATHIPAETGAGRAYLDSDVMKKKGISGLYTSNSKGTAEGYTYGEGYVVKAKKPTDFSSSSREAWIDNNIPDIQTGNDYKYSGKPITWKTDYEINNKRTLDTYREKLGRQKLEADYPSTPTEYNGETWDAIHPEVKKFNDRRDQLRNIAEEEYNLAADPYKDKLFTVEDRLKRRSENYKLNNTSTFKRVLNVPAVMRDLMMEGYYGGKVSRLNQKNADAWNDARLATYLEKYPELANAYPEVNPYAHYINIGKPGEKVLEAMSTRKITPETWKNKSRGHQGEYFRQATRREFGGMYGSGGPIVDPMGQWAHPGQVTRIPSANITMQGVPYPVLGVASNGKQVMMQPGQDYNFGNAEHVDEYPMMANGGYTVTRSSDRKGKTHKVTGPGGVVKYFGDSNLGQHPKDPERKKAFYARHKSNLAGNPFFRAFARKTWAEGGQTDDDREMLSGVADMLRRVNDVNNRKQIANYMMNNFREENVTFEPNKFLRSANAFGNAIPKAQTGKQVRSKPLFSQSQIDLYNRLVAEKEAAEKEEAAKKLAAMREYYENRPSFSENKSPRQKPEPWTDPVLDRIDRENNEKYADSDSGFENVLEFLDPTGISSWDDVSRTFRNPSASNLERGFALFSALPYVGKLGKLAKGTKAINTAVKGNALQKIGRGALKGAAKTVDIVTGGPAMRYFDQTINPLSRGFGTLTEKAVGQIPYSGVRKAFEIGSDFNQMRRFQDGVLIPGFNQLDNYMTQPANSQKPWWKQ